jgi:integrase
MAGSVTFILKEPLIDPDNQRGELTAEDRKRIQEVNRNRSNRETPIYAVFWYYDKRIKVSTGERIKPKFWNPETHRAKETKQFPQWDNLNTTLKEKKERIENLVRDHQNANGTVFLDKLRDELVEVLRPRPKDDPRRITLFRAIREYIDKSNKAPRTKLSYEMTLKTLQSYSATLPRELTFDDINTDFYEGFVKFLTYSIQHGPKSKKTGKIEHLKTGYSKNTIGSRIKNLKVFMGYAVDKGYTLNTKFRNKNFKKVEETAETIYLTDTELLTLYQKDLSDRPKLDRVRDLFLIGCYTGLRFSDLSQLTPQKFTKGGTRLQVKTIKTGETVVIPLHWTIKEILNKYNGNLPRVPSNQKMNEYIKELGETAGINEPVTITKTNAGLLHDKTFKKWELMTVHTARRSFATNMFLAEVPAISIMKITGHRTERAFMKYIKVTQEQNADKLQSHPYFTKSPLKKVSNDTK